MKLVSEPGSSLQKLVPVSSRNLLDSFGFFSYSKHPIQFQILAPIQRRKKAKPVGHDHYNHLPEKNREHQQRKIPILQIPLQYEITQNRIQDQNTKTKKNTVPIKLNRIGKKEKNIFCYQQIGSVSIKGQTKMHDTLLHIPSMLQSSISRTLGARNDQTLS